MKLKVQLEFSEIPFRHYNNKRQVLHLQVHLLEVEHYLLSFRVAEML